MADPLSIAASVAGLLSLADSVFRGVFRYSREVSDAQRDIKALRDELQAVASVLHGIKLLTETLEGDAPHASFLRLEHIHSCRAVLKEIQSRIAKSDPSSEGNKRIERAKQSLKWPFGKSRTSEMVSELSRQKETLQLALQADTMADLTACLSKVQNIEDKVNQIHQKVESLEVLTRIRMDELRTKILDFFMVDDPSPNLRTAWNLRQPLTGLWLTESPRFREWLTEPQSKLWLSGIPGAGKTILAGATIREALGRLESSPNVGVAFFFCDYKKNSSWEISNILRALIAQLGRQRDSAFEVLEKYYNKIEPRVGIRTSPDVEDLRDLLMRQAKEFDQVLVVVDGLDECGEKAGEVSRMLSEVVQFAANMSMALFSRHEAEISDHLETDFDHIPIAAHTEDISLYVGAELEKRIEQKRLRLGDAMLKDEIMSSLIEKAQGMFRWVACQLDALSECPTDADRRAALQEMPKDLPETYERILHRINQRHGRVQRLARLSLNLIAVEKPNFRLTIPQLCQAVSTPDRPGATLEKQAIVKDEEISRVCSSLVRKSIDGQYFEFSHFSVREYLQDSSLLQNPELAVYHISNEKVYHTVAVQCLRFLLLGNFNRELSQDFEEAALVLEDICDEFPLYSSAAEIWPLTAHRARNTGILQSSELFNLEKVLFDPRKSTNYQNWLVAFYVYTYDDTPTGIPGRIETTREALLSQDISTLHIATAFNLIEVGMWLIDHDASVPTKNSGPSVSDFAVAGILALGDDGKIHPFYEFDISMIQKETRLRERLLARDVKISDVAFWDATKSMFNVAWDAVMDSGSLSSLQFILESGWLLKPEHISTIRDQIQDKYNFDETTMLQFVHYLNSSEAHKVEVGHQLCAIIWNRAIELGFEFTADKSLLPTEITTSYEVLCSTAITAIKNNDLESLKACEHDPRFDFGMTSMDDLECSLLHIAVQWNTLEVLEYLISIARYDIDTPDVNGETPLHYAVSSRGWDRPSVDSQVMLRLLDAGASLVLTDDTGWNVFHHYASRVSEDSDLKKLRELVHYAKNDDYSIFLEESLNVRTAQDSNSSEISFMETPDINFGCCNEEACVWDIAASRGSVAVLKALADVNFPRHPDHSDGRPFLSINYNINFPAFELLQSQFSSILHGKEEGNIPVVTFLSKCVKAAVDNEHTIAYIEGKVIRALLDASPPVSPTLHQALDFCCRLVQAPVSVKKKTELLSPFLDYGFDMHPATPSPSTLSQACQSFPFEVESPDSRSLMSHILDHVDAAKLDQLDLAGLSILHKMHGSFNTDREWLILELIKRGADINIRDASPDQRTALITHLDTSSIDSAILLLKSGADPNLASSRAWNAAHKAITQGLHRFLRELLKLVNTSSIYVDWTATTGILFLKTKQEFHGLNVLHLAATSENLECFDLLVNELPYMNIHATTREGYDCMHFAAYQGHIPMIEHLHRLGVQIYHASADGTTPLHLAVQADENGAVKKLLDLGAPSVANMVGETPLMLAERLGFKNIVETFSKSWHLRSTNMGGSVFDEKVRFKYWQKAMREAIGAGDFQKCEQLLRNGCPVDILIPSCGGCSPLAYTLAYGSSSRIKLIELFLSHSASVSKTLCARHGSGSALEKALCLPEYHSVLPKMLDLTLKDNWTCINGALIVRMITNNNMKGLVTLLAHLKDNRADYAYLLGSSPEDVISSIINGSGDDIPIHEAVWQCDLEAIKLFVEYGADTHAADTSGRTTLHLCQEEDIAKYLLSIGAIPTLPPWHIWYGLSSESIESLMRLGSDLGSKPIFPDFSNWQLLASSISNGLNPDIEDDSGRSIVHLAIYSHVSGSMVLNGAVRLNGARPFPWHQMCYPTQQASWIGPLWRYYRRRFDIEDLRQVTNLHPSLGWSPICLATCTDDTRAMAHCLEMGADIDFEGSPYGSALMAAAFYNRLDSVKFLVRNGAAICYEGKEGFKSAAVIGWRCQRVIEWLLMGRFRDQEKLEGVPDPSNEVGNLPRVATGVWSSMVAPLRLIGDFERQPHESSFDYLLRLVVIKGDMRGKVVPLPRREALPK